MRINITEIEPKENVVKKTTPFLEREINLFGKSFANRAKEEFYSELSILLNSGVSLKVALDLILQSQKNKKHRNIIESLGKDILNGSSFYDALKDNASFSEYECQSIKIGEQTARLDEITEDLGAYFQQKNNLRKQLISSLSYPILILVLATCVVIFMLQFVVPLFADIFKQNNVDFPWITQQIISASDFISNYGTLLLLVLAVIIVGVKLLSKEFWFQKYLSVVQLKTPILGVYLKQIYLVQFTQAMVLLTRSKIPLVKAVGLVKDMIQFYPLQQALDAIEQNMLQGEKLHDSFARHRLFDRKMITLLKVAEETNNTEYSFAKLHEMYKAELDYKGKIMLSFFNFFLTAIVGLIVGIIVIAMYLPMFKLSSALG